MTEKRYTFTYNSKLAVKSPSGTKRGFVIAENKEEARMKIKGYLDVNGGELCIEFF